MSADLALLAGYAPASTVTWLAGRPISAEKFCGAARAIGSVLPAATHAVNLCEQAPNFLLAAAAAWLRGHTLVLPPDRLAHTLDRLRHDFPDAHCLCDTSDVVEIATRQGFVATLVDASLDAKAQWPPPEIPAAFVAACLHTSGSTGAPTQHRKTWGELVAGASTLASAFGVPSPGTGLLGTVAPQHMFGFETTIMFATQSGAPLLPARPSLPADLADALLLAQSFGLARVWLFTTPLQLRAFHAAQERTPGLERVITATMPLDPALAHDVERDWGVPVDEIYGCTEAGMLAFRQPAHSETFSAGPGIRFSIDTKGRVNAAGGHLADPVALSDRIEIVDPGSASAPQQIRLLGRDSDLVKIAGKRASIAGLTATLKSLPGVQDGVFFLPDPSSRRLCAAVVAPGLSAAQMQRALAAIVDPAFLPRPLLFVEAIPRGTSQKISLASLRALAQTHSGEHKATGAVLQPISVRTQFDANDPVFAGHFPARPVVPGVMLLQRVEEALESRGWALRECRSVKFHTPAGPGDALDLRIVFADGGVARFEITKGEMLVASGGCRCEARTG